MKWKKFTDEMPGTGKNFLIRYVDENIKSFFLFAKVKRPYDVQPNKYRSDYYEIQTSFIDDKFVELCDDFKSMFEWIDPNEDRNFAEPT